MLDALYDGDPGLRMTPDGCTIDYESGQPDMDNGGLENAVVISLFSRFGWPGNALDENQPDRQIGSGFEETIEEKPMNSSTLLDIERAGVAALEWMKTVGAVKDITVTASIPKRNRINIVVTLTQPDGAKVPFKYELSWSAGILAGPINTGV